jgi:hypothetical protein
VKRHLALILAAAGAMTVLAALAPRGEPQLLLLEWAAKARLEKPPMAVLIEMGTRDTQPTSWSGRASVQGARVVHREGYRFRAGDKLAEGGAWVAGSHRGLRVPAGNPAVARVEKLATVGVVLHLADIQAGAQLTVEPDDANREKTTVALTSVLAGKPARLWDGAAVVRLLSTATPVVTAKTEDDFPAAAYGPDGTLWLAYVSYTLKEESRRIEPPPLKEPPADFKDYYTPGFGDQLFVKYLRDGRWSAPLAVTAPHQDLARCAIAVDKEGTAWVAYSANREGNFDIYARPINKTERQEEGNGTAARLDPERKLTQNPGPNLSPVLCTDDAGGLLLACQAWAAKASPGVSLFKLHDGMWKGIDVIGETVTHDNYCWSPAVAAGANGRAALAFDVNNGGDYDVFLKTMDGEETRGSKHPIATSSRFEARPSICYDPMGRLWITYEEGPQKWGRDYGALDANDGNPLYNARHVRVVCLDENGKLHAPAADLPTSMSRTRHPDEQTLRYAYPRIGIDGKGRVWLTYREKFGTRYSTHPGSYWLTLARRLDGDRWSEPIEIHHSDGLLDDRPVLLPHPSGGLLVIHNTDGRYTTPATIDNQIYMSYVDLPGEPVEPKLVRHSPGTKDPAVLQQAKADADAVQHIRDYRVENTGKHYRLLRGDFHRHTELSWDGGPDGSLEDFFRYGLDVAAMDWIACTDHDNGAGREYSWWLTQKFSDAFHLPTQFTPMFAYERSVAYPHGHRNCMFAQRGVRTLPRLAQPDPDKRVAGIHADDTKMLYRYLHEMHGLCASHTSATGMGTDWRDNDPQVEPVVEIYQGDRMSYEYQDAPRAGHSQESGKKPLNIGGWEPAGFIDLALKKGYQLGFQSSSDHWSTHISYFIVLAERNDRPSIMDGFRQRRCYAATDDIIADVRSGRHLMGERFQSTEPPALQFTLIGTKPLRQVDILKDSQVVHTLHPGKRELKSQWTDPQPEAGVHYYYVRVQQEDAEIAWTSPIWIEYTK